MLSKEEGEAVLVAFGDWQRCVEYGRWWNSLGLVPPSDYTDPELLFDALPQP